MRQRVTFIHKPEDAFDPALLQVTTNSVTGPVVPAVREDRITLALDELPDDLRQVLRTAHELHIRWVSPFAFEAVSPLLSRLSPGFHLFYTPHQEDRTQDERLLCEFLREAFGPLDCDTPNTSFTTLPNDRFSHSTALQYYQPLANLSSLVTYASSNLCPATDASCETRLARLADASSLDVSYDTISHALKATATWALQEQPVVVTSQPAYRTEVGVLSADHPPNLEPHELGMSGVLTVLGQDTKPAATIFAFPSRHRSTAPTSSFSSALLEPAGLHPTLRLTVAGGAAPPRGTEQGSRCSLHAYLTLPRAVFADRYQLSDPLFLASKNLTALRYISQPVDLEAPAYAMRSWGSAALLELSPPPPPPGGDGGSGGDDGQPWTAEVPLHLRYLAPGKGGYEAVEIPYPAVFWACTTEEGTKFPSNPFERVNLGYDGLFGPRTVFWHVEPKPGQGQGGRLVSEVKVPVLDLDKARWVSAGTAGVVLLGFAWIVWKLAGVYLKSGYGSEPAKKAIEKKTQ